MRPGSWWPLRSPWASTGHLAAARFPVSWTSTADDTTRRTRVHRRTRSWPGPTPGTHERATGRMDSSGDIQGSGGVNWNMPWTRRFGSGEACSRAVSSQGAIRWPTKADVVRLPAVHRGTDPRLGRCSSSADRKMAHPGVGSDQRRTRGDVVRGQFSAKCRHAWSPRWFIARRLLVARRPGENVSSTLRGSRFRKSSPWADAVSTHEPGDGPTPLPGLSWKPPASFGRQCTTCGVCRGTADFRAVTTISQCHSFEHRGIAPSKAVAPPLLICSDPRLGRCLFTPATAQWPGRELGPVAEVTR